jgi:hypothetical protein
MKCSPKVVDDRENAEAPTIDGSIRQKVEAPALVRYLRDCQRRPGATRPFTSVSSAHLQPFFTIEAAELLVVHGQTLATHQHEQAAIAEPAATAASSRRRARTAASAGRRLR